MALRLINLISLIGALITATFFAAFLYLAFTEQLTWNFFPTVIFIAIGGLPYCVARSIRYVVLG